MGPTADRRSGFFCPWCRNNRKLKRHTHLSLGPPCAERRPTLDSGSFPNPRWIGLLSIVDISARSVWRGHDRITLTPKAFGVLEYLVRRAGLVVTQSELLEAVWPNTFVQPEIVKTYIRDLRKVLGDDSKNPRFIETLPRRGYRFATAVRESGAPGTDVNAEPAQSTSDETIWRVRAGRRNGFWMLCKQQPNAHGRPWPGKRMPGLRWRNATSRAPGSASSARSSPTKVYAFHLRPGGSTKPPRIRRCSPDNRTQPPVIVTSRSRKSTRSRHRSRAIHFG